MIFGKSYRQQLATLDRLQKLYRDANAKAAQGEGLSAAGLKKIFGRSVLKQIGSQAKAAQDALESTEVACG